jgi:hypothetical protein
MVLMVHGTNCLGMIGPMAAAEAALLRTVLLPGAALYTILLFVFRKNYLNSFRMSGVVMWMYDIIKKSKKAAKSRCNFISTISYGNTCLVGPATYCAVLKEAHNMSACIMALAIFRFVD